MEQEEIEAKVKEYLGDNVIDAIDYDNIAFTQKGELSKKAKEYLDTLKKQPMEQEEIELLVSIDDASKISDAEKVDLVKRGWAKWNMK